MCDSSTVGSTPPCQGGGRGFESRLSLLVRLMIFISLFFHSCKFLIKLLIKSKDPICQSCARYTKRDPLSLFCKSLIPSFYLF